MKIAIIGACECGIAHIDVPDSIDSGSTFRCENNHTIIFDVWNPEQRKEFFDLYALGYAVQKSLS